MRIQFCSDLHLEFYLDSPFKKPGFFEQFLDPTAGADVLVLAGDIGYPEHSITKQFLHWCCSNWPRVIWIFGNHEYYNELPNYLWRSDKSYTMSEKEAISMDYTHYLSNLFVCIKNAVKFRDFPGIRFVGTTLWTDVKSSEADQLSGFMNDFVTIKRDDGYQFTVADWTKRYFDEYKFIQDQLDEAKQHNEKVVVITHHLPSYRMCQEQYKNSNLNCGFMAHADSLLEHPAVATWICGHSHGVKSEQIQKQNGETIYCHLNARGYPRESSQLLYNKAYCINL
jgi:UDP-2,3-diacylglucosamine pyrophosphatase LpxH